MQACNNITFDSSLSQSDTEKDVKRQLWQGKFEFLMSCISLSVGLGNIWRFPYTAYTNGGGAFIIPYIIVLLFIGKPMYNMEALLGQFCSKSSIDVWSICPVFVGVGVGQVYAVSFVLTYYSSLVAIAFVYLFSSFQSVLPWSHCQDDWIEYCIDSRVQWNFTSKMDIKLYSSSELYFIKEVLKEKDDISSGIGVPDWKLTIALLSSWILTTLAVMKGVKSLGKASYFLATFPYVMLITLLIRAVTLQGAFEGILFLLRPKWEDLLQIKVWKEAVVQCFFSLTVSLGPIITFSSYNKFGHNVQRDALIITSLDTITSLLAGIATFGILGNLAYNMKESDIGNVVRSGTGLAFISYPDALAKFDSVPQLFAALFFLMICVLGIGTVAALQTTVVTIICDKFKISSQNFWKISVTVSTCGFLIGLVYITPVRLVLHFACTNLFLNISFCVKGGQWILFIVDYYAGTYVVFFMACCEVIGISWIYGMQNFCVDIEFMTKRKVSMYWRLCWGICTPVFMIFIFFYSLVELKKLSYGGSSLPLYAEIIGWIVFSVGILQFPFWGLRCIVKHFKGNYREMLQNVRKPSAKWGPSDIDNRHQWDIHKNLLKNVRKQRNTNKK